MRQRCWASLHLNSSVLLSLWLQCCLISFTSAQTAATDGPANYQGLYVNPTGAVEPLNCGTSSVFAMVHTHAGCCRINGNCNFPTACTQGKPTNRLGKAWTCGPDRDCYTMTVYAEYPIASESWVVYNCAKSWSAHTIYRKMPASMVTAASTVTPTGTGPGEISPAPDAEGAEQDEGDSVQQQEQGGTSQAWVAGVAVGSLVLGAALGWLLYWLWRRKRTGHHGGPEEESKKGFTLHAARLLRSGGTTHQWDDHETAMAKGTGRARAVVVADRVEVEGDRGEWKAYGLRSPQEVGGTTTAELDASSAAPQRYV